MSLPKAKKTKLIDEEKFIRLAKKVNKSFEEEVRYILETKMNNGDKLRPCAY